MHSRIPVLLMVSALLGLLGVGVLAQKATDRVTGDKWQGTLHNEITSAFSVGAGGNCTGEAWDYDLSLVVGHDGTVEGTIVGHLVSPPKCSFTMSTTRPQAKKKSGDVSGRFDGRQFELQINITSTDGYTHGCDSLVGPPGEAPKLVVPVTDPGIAQGATSTKRTAGTVVGSGRQTVKLKRECDPKYRLTPEAVTQAIERAFENDTSRSLRTGIPPVHESRPLL